MNQAPTDSDSILLVVDGDPAARRRLVALFTGDGYRVETAEDPDERFRQHDGHAVDVALIALANPDEPDGAHLLARWRERHPDTPIVLTTAEGGRGGAAVAALRAGAFDCLSGPIPDEALRVTVERALAQRRLEAENRRLRRALDGDEQRFGELVGKSAAMNEIQALIRKVASSRSNVLITGESGTGKEVVARTIHRAGPRRHAPFVPVRCAGLSEDRLAHALFGGGGGAREGRAESRIDDGSAVALAAGGTLFLDEIGDLSPALQARLLALLQERASRPLDATAPHPLDEVRLVAATHRDLQPEVAAGRFRRDLYYRLAVIPIAIPPLRERREDIPVLATHFLRERTDDDRFRFSEHALRKLARAPWLGNARELENCIERALSLAESPEIRARDILLSSDDGRGGADASLRDELIRLALDGRVPLKELSEAYIDAALEAAQGRKSLAARILDVNRRTLYRREERIERRRALEASDDFDAEPLAAAASRERSPAFQ
ncbi:MAG: sigma-54 dependent transcriptional regulator [Myxococcota bacterium]